MRYSALSAAWRWLLPFLKRVQRHWRWSCMTETGSNLSPKCNIRLKMHMQLHWYCCYLLHVSQIRIRNSRCPEDVSQRSGLCCLLSSDSEELPFMNFSTSQEPRLFLLFADITAVWNLRWSLLPPWPMTYHREFPCCYKNSCFHTNEVRHWQICCCLGQMLLKGLHEAVVSVSVGQDLPLSSKMKKHN